MPILRPKKLAIWVPAGKKAGLGHLYRTMGIYEAFEDAFYLSEGGPAVPNGGLRIERLTGKESPEEILGLLKAKAVGSLYIDHYFLPPDTLDFFARQSDIAVLFFDAQFENPSFPALVNSNPFASLSSYRSRREGAHYFLGSEYYCFRKEIRLCVGRPKVKNRVVVSIGGSDACGTTLLLLSHLPADREYQVVVGPAAGESYFREVEQKFRSLGLSGSCLFGPGNFFDLLSSAETAVISASTTAYEATFLGTPFLCVRVADNQTRIAEYLRGQRVQVLEKEDLLGLRNLISERKAVLPSISFESKKQELLGYIANRLA